MAGASVKAAPMLIDVGSIDPARVAAVLSGPPEDALPLLRDLARAGFPEAQTRLGQHLLDGIGVEADPGEALAQFLEAAYAAHPLATNMVGRCYEKGWGAPVNLEVASQWYRRAGLLGFDWGMYNYADMLASGRGIAQDRGAAFDWLSRAAALNHIKSINLLGQFYEEGAAVARDLAKARGLYLRAAEGGDFRGQFNHARCLGDDGQFEDAASWLLLAYSAATPDFRATMIDFLCRSIHSAFRAAADDLQVA